MGHHVKRLDGVIVAIGNFNPAIITPEWLLRRGLIPESELEVCLSKMQALVQDGLMAFESTWFSFRLVQNQLALATTTGVTPRLRDLAAGIFSLLPETPLTAIGINFVADIQFDDNDEYQNFGYALAPKSIWNQLYPKSTSGLASLTIALDGAETEGQAAMQPVTEQRRFTIQPSNIVGPHAVSIAYNHHYPLNHTTGARDALKVIVEKWDQDQSDAENAFKVLGQISAEKND